MDDPTVIAGRIVDQAVAGDYTSQLETRQAALRHALRRYGDHDQGCPAHDATNPQTAARCVCGYSAILKEHTRG